MARTSQARLRAPGEHFVNLSAEQLFYPEKTHWRYHSTIAVAGGGIRSYLAMDAPGRRGLKASFAFLRHYLRPMRGEVNPKALYYACKFHFSKRCIWDLHWREFRI
jgi:hypothetical protein